MAALSYALRRLFPPLKVKSTLLTSIALLALYGLFVSWLINIEHFAHIDWGAESTVLNGLVLGFLIAFRNNHAYDRWWEARKLWGQLINDSRNLCLKVRSLVGAAPVDGEAVGRLVAEFAEALKDHLRRRDGFDERISLQEHENNRVHRPIQIAGAIYDAVFKWKQDGQIDGWTMLMLDGQIKSFMDICGACERIRNTPLSSSYRALLRHGIALYLLITPFYLIEDIGLPGLPTFLLAAYFLLGIELVAEEIEEPFGTGGDNLPLERYCATIEASVRQILGAPRSSLSPFEPDRLEPVATPPRRPGAST
jgi:ion channel-forming bestrophin family protein